MSDLHGSDAYSPLEIARRIEAVDRIQQAASGLVERIAEIEAGEDELIQLEHRLQELTAQLISLPEEEHQDASLDFLIA